MNDINQLPKVWPVNCAHTKVMTVEELLAKQRPDNPNQHPPNQLDTYILILEAQGWRKPVTLSRESGFIVTGHGAVLAAQRAGQLTCPVDEQSFATAELEIAHVIADNRLPQLSDIDFKKIADSIKTLPKEFNLELTGYKNDEALNLLLTNWQPPKLTSIAGSKPDKEQAAHPLRFDGHQWAKVKPHVARLRRENPAFQLSSDVDCITHFVMNYKWPVP